MITIDSLNDVDIIEIQKPQTNFFKRVLVNLSLVKPFAPMHYVKGYSPKASKRISIDSNKSDRNSTTIQGFKPYTIDRLNDKNFQSLISELRTIKMNGGNTTREEEIIEVIFSRKSIS
jgi:hypothetical protein